MRTRSIRMSAGVMAAALAVFAGACSSDSDDASADGTAGSTTTVMEESTEKSTQESTMDDSASNASTEDIVDTAVAAGDFTTLVTAVQAAGLEETLRGEGPFTVFAPTDAAFEALPDGTVEQLLQDPTGDLASILKYHVVEGRVLASDVAGLDGQKVTTVNGATFTVGVADDGSVTLTDGAGNEIGVTTTDIETSNGVIHVIDGVLMPS